MFVTYNFKYQTLLPQHLKAGNEPGDEAKLHVLLQNIIIIHTLCSIVVLLEAILFSQEFQSFVFWLVSFHHNSQYTCMYHSLMKMGPWAVHLTLGSNEGRADI